MFSFFSFDFDDETKRQQPIASLDNRGSRLYQAVMAVIALRYRPSDITILRIIYTKDVSFCLLYQLQIRRRSIFFACLKLEKGYRFPSVDQEE